MKNEILDEVKKNLSWREKIVFKLFEELFYKVYKLGITYGFNNK